MKLVLSHILHDLTIFIPSQESPKTISVVRQLCLYIHNNKHLFGLSRCSIDSTSESVTNLAVPSILHPRPKPLSSANLPPSHNTLADPDSASGTYPTRA